MDPTISTLYTTISSGHFISDNLALGPERTSDVHLPRSTHDGLLLISKRGEGSHGGHNVSTFW